MAAPPADFTKPTPQDFDRFVPWVLMLMQNPMVVVVERTRQVEYESKKHAKTSTTKLKAGKLSSTEIIDSKTKVQFSKSVQTTDSTKVFLSVGYDFRDILVVITAYYDQAQNLTEIAFIDSPLPIHRQVFKVISLCLPFHSRLTRFTFKGKHLDCCTIYQIAKILPFSNFTDIILDHSNVPQGNFYILLDEATTLKYLSLSDCDIEDECCKEIADRLELGRPAAEKLVILNLSINKITDLGAQALGHVLRTNRRLLHLNLCSNSITSIGAAHVLYPLTDFPMHSLEIWEMQKRKHELSIKKAAVSAECLKDITNKNTEKLSSRSSKFAKDHKTGSHRATSVFKVPFKHDKEDREATDIVKYNDAFDSSETVYRNGVWYCNGNLHLCSLNLAYNKLEFSSLVRIVDVLFYQNLQQKTKFIGTGLMRVVIEGNCLPTSCVEYDLINMYLNKAIPQTMKKRGNSIICLTKDKSRIKRE